MASRENEVQIGAQGQVVTPAARVLERCEAVERRLRERFRQIPAEVSLADELISARRAEAAREAGDA